MGVVRLPSIYPNTKLTLFLQTLVELEEAIEKLRPGASNLPPKKSNAAIKPKHEKEKEKVKEAASVFGLFKRCMLSLPQLPSMTHIPPPSYADPRFRD
jgi:hypothetical protein